MRPGANRRDQIAFRHFLLLHVRSFNEARRESPGSVGSHN